MTYETQGWQTLRRKYRNMLRPVALAAVFLSALCLNVARAEGADSGANEMTDVKYGQGIDGMIFASPYVAFYGPFANEEGLTVSVKVIGSEATPAELCVNLGDGV